MKTMSHVQQNTRGRKRILTDSSRKRKRQEVQAKYHKGRINIGSELIRWNELKTALQVESHAEVAKVLLDRYEQMQLVDSQPSVSVNDATPIHLWSPVVGTVTPSHKIITSTPGPSAVQPQPDSDISKISSGSEVQAVDSENQMSGIEELTSRKRKLRQENFTKKKQKEQGSSFINPLELTINITEDETICDNSSDEDYEPSFQLSVRENDDTVIEIDEDEEDEDVDFDNCIEVETGPGLNRINRDNIEELADDHPCLAFYSQLLNLANTHVESRCSSKPCCLDVYIVKEVVASAVYLKWVCKSGHVSHRWCSQPILNRGMHSGDIMLAASIVLSGSNFQKISMFAKTLKLPVLSKSTFFRIQRHYIIPSVDDFWLEHQNQTLDDFRDQDLVILGDGRMDTPGHSAQYCSYTFMENETKRILCVVTMDKRMTGKKSSNLEKACFLKGLTFLLEKQLKIKEIVTDAHVQVASVMKKDYPHIKHSWDIWHGTKNLAKKIIKAGQSNECKEVLDWTKDVVNHYWYTAQYCHEKGLPKEVFVGMWIGVLHHVINEHEWLLPYSHVNKCEHGPLTSERDKGWLKRESSAHTALRKIVLDKRLLNNIPYYMNCRSTAELENFQNLILMYASKRHSYTPPTYRCRNLLAALDHNNHVDRPVLTNRDGSVRFQRVFQKKSSRWSVTKCKTEKEYSYIPNIMHNILVRRIEDDIGMNQQMELEADDPRRISAHLAPIPPPPTLQIVSEQRSRFRTDSSSTQDIETTVDYWQQ